MSFKKWAPPATKRMSAICLGVALAFPAIAISPQAVEAAIAPLPGPSNPLVYDNFSGGGVFKQNWMNWFNQDGGTAAFTKATEDSREIGKFAQTPVSNKSWAKFQPWNETVDLTGYRYLNFSLKNPGYSNAQLRVVINDGSRNYTLINWESVDSDWTTRQFDMEALSPAINKKKIKFEVWLRQTGGTYGEIWMDDIVATTASGSSAPVLSEAGMTSNTEGIPNQNTAFTFTSTYTDADNEKPFAMQVVIDDTAYDMKENDASDIDYTDGKDYTYLTKLPVGSHSYFFRATDLTSDGAATSPQTVPTIVQSNQTLDVVASQVGYSIHDVKNAKVASTLPLADTTYEIFNGSGTLVASGDMEYEGVTWEKHVYTIDFSSVATLGQGYTVKTNGVSSFPFSIETNVWSNYTDEMTAFYRLLRASVSTEEAYPPGYSSVAPSAKLYHAAGHLDDGASADGTQHYDLTGGWYDAGDYGKYGGNQWVGAQIALAYVRYADKASVKFDNDDNGIPDLIDEAIWGSEYVIKFADQLGGAMYNLRNNAAFVHPAKATDNIPGTADDRKITDYGVGGSAKAAGTLAATARAIQTAIAQGDVESSKIAELTAFAAESQAAAEVFYQYVLDHYNDPIGSYSTRGGIDNSMLLADVEMYLLTNDTDYKDAATIKINALTFADLYTTNYWDMRPMSLAEFYPAADPTTQAHIHDLLKQQVNYFLSSADDTPYGVFNQFKNFGVNEPHASYLGDLLRYYELFGDPAALNGVLKGLYWIFGENPWNISWVSGIGSDFVDFPHTRYDEESNTPEGKGIVFPGAMLSGPNIKDTKNKKSVSPWYEDRSLDQDDTNQWRYNEFSVSIQAGLLYTIMGLSATDSAAIPSGTTPQELPILSPIIGDYVRGDVTIFADPADGVSSLQYSVPGVGYQAMTPSGEVFAGMVDESATAPFFNRRIDVKGTDANGNDTYSSTHYTVASPLPDPSTPLLYDDMGGGGLWGSTGGNSQWVNWYTQNGGSATFAKTTADGRTVGKFTQTPGSATSNAKFQPWHDALDLSGYRYLNFTVKNPGYTDLRMKIELSDGTRTHNLTGGWASVPTDWTNLAIDLDGLANPVKKENAKLAIWLNQTGGAYGELLVDEIAATNVASGSAPVLTDGGVNTANGDRDTDYTFGVTYTDADNEAPFAMELVLDGIVRYMEALDPSDTNFEDGKAYTYTTKLQPGVHSYYFHTTDTSSDAVSTGVLVGPEVGSGEIVVDPTTLFSDDFEDGNADGWLSTSGVWNVTDGAYNGKASSGNSFSIAGDAEWTDYTLETKVNITNNSGGNKDAGLVFRYTDPNNTYMLYLKNNDRSGRKMELVKVVGGVKTVLAHASPSIAANTFYTYRIVAEGDSIEVYKDDVLELSATDNAIAQGKIGARVFANTLAIYDDVTVSSTQEAALPEPPGSPAGLAAEAGAGVVTLAWAPAEGTQSFLIKRSLIDGGPYETIAEDVIELAYVDQTVENGKTYFYIVTAVNEAGESEASAQASATPLEEVVEPELPNVIDSLTAVPGVGQIALAWAPSEGADSYLVKRSLTNGGPYETIADGVAGTAYIDESAEAGTTYYYIVSAVNAAGESAASNQASAAPQEETVEPEPEPEPSIVSTNGKLKLPAGQSGRVSLEGKVTIDVAEETTSIKLDLGILKTWSILWDKRGKAELASDPYVLYKTPLLPFAKAVTLTMSFDSAKVDDNQSVGIFYYDVLKQQWLPAGVTTVEGDQASVQINQFAIFAVLVVDEATGAPIITTHDWGF
ncbi:glycoside hydrolase family 9 protein [Paenibacillus sp. strain BS8-2]